MDATREAATVRDMSVENFKRVLIASIERAALLQHPELPRLVEAERALRAGDVKTAEKLVKEARL